jgi:hypothetical protein
VTTLWDTTGRRVKALAADGEPAEATSGNALTLVVIVDERDVHEAEEAATLAKQAPVHTDGDPAAYRCAGTAAGPRS